MTPPRDLHDADPEDLEQAVAWREHASERLMAALQILDELHAGMPISLERIQLGAVLPILHRTLRTCDDNVRAGRRVLRERE